VVREEGRTRTGGQRRGRRWERDLKRLHDELVIVVDVGKGSKGLGEGRHKR
jgi:hypothetical protein